MLFFGSFEHLQGPRPRRATEKLFPLWYRKQCHHNPLWTLSPSKSRGIRQNLAHAHCWKLADPHCFPTANFSLVLQKKPKRLTQQKSDQFLWPFEFTLVRNYHFFAATLCWSSQIPKWLAVQSVFSASKQRPDVDWEKEPKHFEKSQFGWKCESLTKWMIPAAVSQTEMKMEINWANLMEVEVFKMLRYCKMSGTVISLKALRNRRPGKNEFTIKKLINSRVGQFSQISEYFFALSFSFEKWL